MSNVFPLLVLFKCSASLVYFCVFLPRGATCSCLCWLCWLQPFRSGRCCCDIRDATYYSLSNVCINSAHNFKIRFELLRFTDTIGNIFRSAQTIQKNLIESKLVWYCLYTLRRGLTHLIKKKENGSKMTTKTTTKSNWCIYCSEHITKAE